MVNVHTENNKLQPNIKELEKALNNDLDLVLFFLSWIKHGRNATEAYLELNPTVDRTSAQVLGSRQLAKIDRGAVMKSYGLGAEEYFQQLADGLKAERRDQFSGEMYPDHKTRKDYHDKLGKLLGIESSTGINIEAKILVLPSELLTKYEISSDTSNSSKG